MNPSLRWAAIGIFVLFSTLNYLDRQLLPALAPTLRAEFRLSNESIGWVISFFSLIYALSAPAAGLFIDRVGLNRGACTALGLWSMVTMATGCTSSFLGLAACRGVLGVAQSGSVPSFGKASSVYLKPGERAIGSALSQTGISMGGILAPIVAGWFSARYGWRSAFLFAGSLGAIWIPVWLFMSRRLPRPKQASTAVSMKLGVMLRNRQYWGLVSATVLAMTVYSLWTNWTTVFLVKVWNLSEARANLELAWIPPVCGTIGGLLGGAISLRLTRGGLSVHAARMRACLIAATFLLSTAAAPFMPNVKLATAAIGLSFFWSACLTVNLYSMPIDIFGSERAAFGTASLTFAYGAMQTLLSPVIGRMVDRVGFGPVCGIFAILPLAAVAVLKLTAPAETAQ